MALSVPLTKRGTVLCRADDSHLNSSQAWMCGALSSSKNDKVLSSLNPQELTQVLVHALETGCGFGAQNKKLHKQFVLYKTHKTASSTIESMLMRFAILHGLSFVGSAFYKRQHWPPLGCPMNLTALHHCFDYEVRHPLTLPLSWYWRRNFRTTIETLKQQEEACDHGDGKWFDQAVSNYRRLIHADVAIIVPVREPNNHMRSTMHYYNVSIDAVAKDRSLWNPLAQDFKISTAQQAANFGARWLSEIDQNVHPIVLESLETSLALLRRRLGWSFRDVLYLSVIHPTDRVYSADCDLDKVDVKPYVEVDAMLYRSFANLHSRLLSRSRPLRQEALALKRMSSTLERLCHVRLHVPHETILQLCSWRDKGELLERDIAATSARLCRPKAPR